MFKLYYDCIRMSKDFRLFVCIDERSNYLVVADSYCKFRRMLYNWGIDYYIGDFQVLEDRHSNTIFRLRHSIYSSPSCNGAVERFAYVLKNVLARVCIEENLEAHRYLGELRKRELEFKLIPLYFYFEEVVFNFLKLINLSL